MRPVESGSATLKDAINEAMRDWVTNVASSYYVLGSAMGPHPYPTIVRDMQRVIGDEAAVQIQEVEGRLPDFVVACVGGGSNAIGLFSRFIGEPAVRLVAVEAAGEGVDTGRHAAALGAGSPGIDVVVPMLDETVTLAGRGGAEEVVFGMAHRGRLSVLAHNLGRSVESIMAEFEGSKQLGAVKAVAAIPTAAPATSIPLRPPRRLRDLRGREVSVRLYPNPSHLEFVNPVVTGGARYLQADFEGSELNHDPKRAVPVLLHGDAAFPAQGVVAETLNLQALKGYRPAARST